MVDLFAPFIIGFLGSFHCLGMCGPLVVAYSLHLKSPSCPEAGMRPLWQIGVLHHLAFQAGRLLTYGFLGFAAAGLVHLMDLKQTFSNMRGGVTLFGGILMAFAGLCLLRVIPLPSLLLHPFSNSSSLFSRWFSSLFQTRNLISKMILGLLTGFLPCMLSWAMVLKAGTTGNPLSGLLTMALFGLGTVPVLFFVGLSASVISLKMRITGERIAGISIIVMGLILVLKGVRSLV